MSYSPESLCYKTSKLQDVKMSLEEVHVRDHADFRRYKAAKVSKEMTLNTVYMNKFFTKKLYLLTKEKNNIDTEE